MDGTYPSATTQWEKRNIALEIPVWEPDICIQCAKCALACPHAAIRFKIYDPAELDGAPETGGRSGTDFERGLQPPYVGLATEAQETKLDELNRRIAPGARGHDVAERSGVVGQDVVHVRHVHHVVAQVEIVEHLSRHDIPVCAHLGLKPQSVHKIGGFKVQGREPDKAQEMLQSARRLQDAGADMMVLECVPEPLAARITRALDIPVIGIGASPACDGQVLVLYDILGMHANPPRFVADFLRQGGNIRQALEAYVAAVREGSFPSQEQSYQ